VLILLLDLVPGDRDVDYGTGCLECSRRDVHKEVPEERDTFQEKLMEELDSPRTTLLYRMRDDVSGVILAVRVLRHKIGAIDICPDECG